MDYNLCPWNSPSKNTEVSSHSLLHGIFPIQEFNPGLLHRRWILYHMSHQENPWEIIQISFLSVSQPLKASLETFSYLEKGRVEFPMKIFN